MLTSSLRVWYAVQRASHAVRASELLSAGPAEARENAERCQIAEGLFGDGASCATERIDKGTPSAADGPSATRTEGRSPFLLLASDAGMGRPVLVHDAVAAAVSNLPQATGNLPMPGLPAL